MKNSQNDAPALKKETSEASKQEITPAIMEEFLDNQRKDLELRSKELDLEKQKENLAFAFSKEALIAQVDDRKEQRAFQLQERKNTYYFAAFISVLVLILLVTALIMGRDMVALEIVKAVIFIVTGGAGGYAVGRIKGQNNTDQTTSNKSES